MGAEKTTIKEGNKIDYPKVGDEVTIHYTGTLQNGDKYENTNHIPYLRNSR